MKTVKLKKVILSIATAAALCFTVGSSAACSVATDHPEAQINIEFNDKTYTVKYKLYRNMYPNTVQHFIELADNGFYNNTVIHNYGTNDWFTGAYEYDADDYAALSSDASRMSEYFDIDRENSHSKEKEYVDLFEAGKFTPSVYATRSYENGKEVVKKQDALYTVMGEFKNNIEQVIENNPLSAEYGCLKMFYYEKETTQTVFVTPPHDGGIFQASYKNNCATSVFALQTGTSSSYSANSYTVFGKVDGSKVYDEFVDAVKEYISDYYDTASEFYNVSEASVDNYESFSNKAQTDKGISVTFNVPKVPIIIKSVKITKY